MRVMNKRLILLAVEERWLQWRGEERISKAVKCTCQSLWIEFPTKQWTRRAQKMFGLICRLEKNLMRIFCEMKTLHSCLLNAWPFVSKVQFLSRATHSPVSIACGPGEDY